MVMQEKPQQMNSDTPNRASGGLTLWPHRSLSQRGFRLLMLALAGLMFLIGSLFFVLGAWPVIGFLGLEILVVWMAFRMNYRAAKKREHLRANSATFQIERVEPDGTAEIEELPTPWLKARLDKEPLQGRPTASRLVVGAHGEETEIGAFLHDAEKEELLPEIKAMLEKAQR